MPMTVQANPKNLLAQLRNLHVGGELVLSDDLFEIKAPLKINKPCVIRSSGAVIRGIGPKAVIEVTGSDVHLEGLNVQDMPNNAFNVSGKKVHFSGVTIRDIGKGLIGVDRGGVGIRFSRGSDGGSVDDCDIEGIDHAIYVNSNDVKISLSDLSAPKGTVVQTNGQGFKPGGCKRIVVSGNRIHDGQVGLMLLVATDCSVKDNLIWDIDGDGVDVAFGSSRNVFRGNQIVADVCFRFSNTGSFGKSVKNELVGNVMWVTGHGKAHVIEDGSISVRTGNTYQELAAFTDAEVRQYITKRLDGGSR